MSFSCCLTFFDGSGKNSPTDEQAPLLIQSGEDDNKDPYENKGCVSKIDAEVACFYVSATAGAGALGTLMYFLPFLIGMTTCMAVTGAVTGGAVGAGLGGAAGNQVYDCCNSPGNS